VSEINPYQSPTVVTNTPEGRRPLFRWRVLPTVRVGLYGGALVLSGLVALLSLPVMLMVVPEKLSASVILGGVLAVAVGTPVGLLACAAAKWWWQGRWRRAIVGTIVFVLIDGAAALVANLLRNP
jgi:hypothetical protein